MQRLANETMPDLPTLEDQCYLLETDDGATGPLQSLVLDHLLLNDGRTYWIDAAGHARADTLARLAPSKRLLDRMQVARGFTAYQHTALVDRVINQVDEGTALVVAPALDALYRDDVQGPTAEAMVQTTVDRLAGLCRDHEIPVIVTCHRRDELTAPVADRVETTIRCENTRFGPRFVGETFETLVYRDGADTVQTTLAFWERVLSRRATAATTTTGVTARGSN